MYKNGIYQVNALEESLKAFIYPCLYGEGTRDYELPLSEGIVSAEDKESLISALDLITQIRVRIENLNNSLEAGTK